MDTKYSNSSLLTIPHQLKDCRFFPLKYHSKEPACSGHLDGNNSAIDDPALLEHIRRGGNYGILLRGDVYAIDCDAATLYDLIPEEWKETFTVRTGRESDDGRHVFLRCSDGVTGVKVVFGASGDIRTPDHRSYLVGPGSIHPDSNRPYTVEKDLPILEVSWQALSEYIESAGGEVDEEPEEKDMIRKIRRSISQTLSDQYNLRPETYLMPDGAKRIGQSLVGSHPIHGSTGGHNLHIDTAKGVWHCFRCGSGGDAAAAYAVSKGIIQCHQAKPGCLRSPAVMFKVLTALEEDGLKPIFQIDETGFIKRLLERANKHRCL